MGPLLFLCYIDEMATSLICVPQNNLCLYADDSNLKVTANTVEQVEITSYIELENIGNFLKDRNLLLNAQKN